VSKWRWAFEWCVFGVLAAAAFFFFLVFGVWGALLGNAFLLAAYGQFRWIRGLRA
jgi:hypothetical protein